MMSDLINEISVSGFGLPEKKVTEWFRNTLRARRRAAKENATMLGRKKYLRDAGASGSIVPRCAKGAPTGLQRHGSRAMTKVSAKTLSEGTRSPFDSRTGDAASWEGSNSVQASERPTFWPSIESHRESVALEGHMIATS